MPEGQKRAPDPTIDGCEQPCGCWELNSGPLEEQPALLTADPSLQLPHVAHVLFGINNKNPESDVGVNAEDQRSSSSL